MAVAGNLNSGGKKQFNKNQIQKRKRVFNARTIRTEAILASSANKNNSTSDISESGAMLNVNQFISTRIFEIKQLQIAMHKSKTSGATRVFQDLPRKLRRRTVSHNIKRIPKRMRNRALREMLKNDQKPTLIKKGKKRHGLTAKALYQAKMSIKLLRLASKSNSMRLAFPNDISISKSQVRQKIRALKRQINHNKTNKTTMLNNDMGSYDNVGINELAPKPKGRLKYMKRQLQFTWLPSHIWNAKRSHMIKRWGYQLPWSATQKCFKLTHRLGSGVAASDGTLCMDSSFIGTIVLTAKPEQASFLKETIHKLTNGRASLPKYYSSKTLFQGLVYTLRTENNDISNALGPIDIIWIDESNVILRLHPAIYGLVFNSLIKFKEKVTVKDCRYSIASITLRGAESLSALTSILRSTHKSKSYQCLKLISKVTDDSILPTNSKFAFTAIDPRHLGAPKKVKLDKNDVNLEKIMNMQANATNETNDEIYSIVKNLISESGRQESYKNQQTLKQLSKRRQNLKITDSSLADNSIIPFDAGSDPSVPIVIYKREEDNDWVILLPWFWHLPFWYQINRIPRIFNVGIRQVQQLQYESKKLYFPDDYPFTEVGYVENSIYKRESIKSRWENKPSGKRVNFDRIRDIHDVNIPAFNGEIGDYFSSDWRLLQILRNGISFLTKAENPLKISDLQKTAQFDESGNRLINTLNDLFELKKDLDSDKLNFECSTLPIRLISNGHQSLKISEKIAYQREIVEKPLSVGAISCTYLDRGHMKDNARVYEIPAEHLKYWKTVSEGAYKSDGRMQHDQSSPLPNAQNLIGFITSGAYHLKSGSSMGTGFIDYNYKSSNTNNKLILIRNVGSNTYRIAKWDHIIV